MAVFGDFLLGCSAVGILVCISCAVFPWTLYLDIREVPAALWAVLSGRDASRRLRFVLKARRDADREILASLPKGELYAVTVLRHLAAREMAVIGWILGKLEPSGSRCRADDFSLRSRALPGPVTAVCPESARSTVGCEARLAREGHERYEQAFLAASASPYLRATVYLEGSTRALVSFPLVDLSEFYGRIS